MLKIRFFLFSKQRFIYILLLDFGFTRSLRQVMVECFSFSNFTYLCFNRQSVRCYSFQLSLKIAVYVGHDANFKK